MALKFALMGFPGPRCQNAASLSLSARADSEKAGGGFGGELPVRARGGKGGGGFLFKAARRRRRSLGSPFSPLILSSFSSVVFPLLPPPFLRLIRRFFALKFLARTHMGARARVSCPFLAENNYYFFLKKQLQKYSLEYQTI